MPGNRVNTAKPPFEWRDHILRDFCKQFPTFQLLLNCLKDTAQMYGTLSTLKDTVRTIPLQNT